LFTVDIIFVGMMSSAREAAIYAVLSRLFGIVRGLLQTAAEAAWPVVAEQRETSGVLASFLLRANGWIYGAVMGAMALTLTPFLEWYMGKEWAPPSVLVYLLAARFLITGASSPAGYLLVGLGDFQAVARCVERELVVATLLAVPLGMKWGVLGVAWAFLLATACGTFLPILFVYAKAMKLPPVRLVLGVWWRVLVGLSVSMLVAVELLSFGGQGAQVAVIAAVATLVALAQGLVISGLRLRAARTPELLRVRLRDVMIRI
jgi:O-antigen/teichoic acid export membrane protein